MFDLLLKNLRVEDPVNAVSGMYDIAIDNGKIAAIQKDLSPVGAKKILSFDGVLAIPGIIDLHVHVCGNFGNQTAFSMLARSGVCTALNMAGPTTDLLSHIHEACGLNLASLEDATPGRSLAHEAPSLKESRMFLSEAMEMGAIGVKILGGHYPLTPEGSVHIIHAAREEGGYAAWHAGTTKYGSNIEGLHELCDLVGNEFVHVAHINSYCRGQIRHELQEVIEAQQLLEEHPSLVSESYIAASNGTSFLLNKEGQLASKNTGVTLNILGYENSATGLGHALMDGKAFVFVQQGDETVRLTGQEAYRLWSDAGTNIAGGFDVNPPMPRIALAAARRKNGTFTVDCLATDGGSIPRNVLVSQGLGLVSSGILSMEDYIRKTSWNPSRCLCLKNKGHLGIGADADLSILDFHRQCALATIVGGQVCMIHGYVCGTGGTLITTERARKHMKSLGLSCQYVDFSNGHLPFDAER
ncbi:amidohydrolase family protein [uncultured Mailhella sp.]|uniref:amidohydrolase family protein n=1 Tax=uncultured Mailhella sp. TaxID=1981031 RepID=UPI002618DFB5|nr:amidohydrolase family protein [uncultured Mailhella sp.]